MSEVKTIVQEEPAHWHLFSYISDRHVVGRVHMKTAGRYPTMDEIAIIEKRVAKIHDNKFREIVVQTFSYMGYKTEAEVFGS